MSGGVQFKSIALLSPKTDDFANPVQWRVTLEVFEPVPREPVDVVFSWLGDAAKGKDGDIVLDELEIGPLEKGVNEMVLEHDAPAFDQLQLDSLLDDTGITASFRYKGEEFLHVGVQVHVQLKGKDGKPIADDDDEADIPDEIEPALLLRVIDERTKYVTSRPNRWDASADGEVGSEEDATEQHDSPGAGKPAAATDDSPNAAEFDALAQKRLRM